MTIEVGKDDQKRFWSHVKKNNSEECWEWFGAIDSGGYGKLTLNYKTVSAHRVSYVIANGSIPEGKQILHKCDNPKCVNPSHLYCGTQGDNMSDMISRHLYDPIQIGLHSARFNASEIISIREQKITTGKAGTHKYKLPASCIAKLFNVNKSTILNIWKSEKYLCKEGYYV